MSNNFQGALWALLAAALFVLASAMAKAAVVDYHVLQILFVRQIIVFASTAPTVFRTFPGSLKTRFPALHLLRLVGAFTALAGSIWAVGLLPLTTATTLAFTKIFFIGLLANWFLGEAVGRHRVLATILGFVGVLVVMRPGADTFHSLTALVPVIAALGAAVSVNCVRRLSQTDSTATLLVYQSVFIGLIAAVPMFWLWTAPDARGWLLLLGMGVVSAIGQWVGIKALRLGEASVVGNMEYSNLVFAGILGYLLFAEVPDRYTLIGACIIIGSAVYLLRQDSIRSQH